MNRMYFLMDVFLCSIRMGNAEICVTQGVSSISGYNFVPFSDDLLNTRRMSIEDLIEANKVCVGGFSLFDSLGFF